CGINIAGTVDVKRLAEEVTEFDDVKMAIDYVYMCSDPGQNLIKEKIKEQELNKVIIACCSPSLHEVTFRNTVQSVGLNPYQCEIANIREQCSWVHADKQKATQKAKEIIAAVIEKIKLNESLSPIKVPVIKRALIIGGGVSGIHAALSIAYNGYEVVLVEREASIGGHMAELSETYLTQECSPCLLSSKIVEVQNHPLITILTNSEIEELDGYVGNFKVKIKTKATFVDQEKCDGCGICVEKCPVSIPWQSEEISGKTRAIYIPYPQTIGNKAVIDKKICKYFTEGCTKCKEACPKNAINFKQTDKIREEAVGSIIVATGYSLYPKEKLGEYGYGRYKDVIDGLQFERLISVWGQQNREIRRPSDGKIPREVVFIQCVGSRDPEHGVPYCSKICCMYVAKHAKLYKQAVPEGQAYIFYIDVRAGGKGYDEFVQNAIEEDGLYYIRGKVSKIFQENGKIIVWGVDTLAGRQIEIAADLVVLATAIIPSKGAKELANKLKISSDEYGFFSEVHPKLRPVESPTPGIYLAGCAQAPRDIPESVSHALGAASKVAGLFSEDLLSHEPIVVWVDEDLCKACGICVEVCPYKAREIDKWKKIAKVIEVLCQGCGACVTACPNSATQQRNLTSKQVFNMIDAAISIK
ncbi:CoB--CoM heterodisulfide reductase iron-sulfur subunit A family protein, partial [Candidatus Aminicenantes bacterium AC-335-G13]|nr:CoB--CoM heterodisulfide reductase iron-sulfur subunit A family protein [Candidatus Aminicenantes bacterium AC-335-G13]